MNSTLTAPVAERRERKGPFALNVLTHSAESCFRACPRRYRINYGIGLRPAHDSDALRVGSAFHIGLEELKDGNGESGAEEAIRITYSEATCPPWLTADEFDTERETAVAMAVAYARRYANDGIIKYVANELSFDLPIVNPYTGREYPGYRNAGKIDGIAELPDGRLALIEFKTVGEDIAVDADYWLKLMLDAQISRYMLAARELGYDVQTVVYDATRKPAIRPKNVAKAERAMWTSKGEYFGFALTNTCPERETPAMYGARLMDDMKERPDWYFRRVEIPRLAGDLDEYRRDQWATLKAINACEIDGFWPKNTNACTSPYRCTFIDICRGLRGDPEEEIPAGFVKVENLHPEL